MHTILIIYLIFIFIYLCRMNNRIKSLYVVIHDNRVVVFDTNMTDFVRKFQRLEVGAKNYMHYYNRFKEESSFIVEIDENKYYLQKLI